LLRLKLANAPVSWGVDYANDPKNPPWRNVMNEIADAGYRYTELGPYGYYPTDPAVLRSEFAKRQLTVVGGFLFEVLHDRNRAETVLASANRTIKLLSALGGRYLVTIDHISDERMATAGRSDLRGPLDAERQTHLIDLVDRIADLALSQGIRPVIHQHAGSYIEFEDELEDVLQRLEPSRVGVCIDTGHMTYAGIDPVAFYRRHEKRIQYFHFKDINPDVHARVLVDRVPFLNAVEQNIFCPVGRGNVNWKALAQAMQERRYDGVATVEQDIDPTVSLAPLDDARTSLSFLRSVGF
jgi:inosose dehydratase